MKEGEEAQIVNFYVKPAARMSHAACLDADFQDRIYIFGGSGINIGSENMEDLWEFSLSTFQFKEVRQCVKLVKPPAMYGHSLNSFKNALYLFGGTTGYEFFKDIYKYDLIVNQWQKLEMSNKVAEL